MKLIAFLSAVLFIASPALADSLPNTGDYFIVNADSSEALQPNGATLGQSVLLFESNQAGAQKWHLIRKIDPVTKKPTNKYNVQLASETSLNLQPHPVSNMCAMLSNDPTVLTLDATDAGVVVKRKDGDALYPLASPPMHAEAKFGPNDGSKKFRWVFNPAN